MAVAIHETFTSVLGSSITTIAGFIALCFMSFTLGFDLGTCYGKGVFCSELSAVSPFFLRSFLYLDKPLNKTPPPFAYSRYHRKWRQKLVKIFPVFLVIFALLIVPAYYGYEQDQRARYTTTSDECLPDDMAYVIANTKLSEEFDIGLDPYASCGREHARQRTSVP